jgi:hypothetical protein
LYKPEVDYSSTLLPPLLKSFRKKADAQKYSDDPTPENEQLMSVHMTNKRLLHFAFKQQDQQETPAFCIQATGITLI